MALSVSGKEERLVLERDMLMQSLTEALRDLPGAIACHTFGSIAEGCAGAWSDLDIEVVSTEFGMSTSRILPTLAKMGPLGVAWIIDSSDDEWAASFVFQESSLFHKVDLGVRPMDALEKSPLTQPSKVMWTQQAPRSANRPEFSGAPFMPEPGSGQHLLLGHLLSITRYVKARKRGSFATCWRFSSALADAVFAAKYSTVKGAASVQGSLGTMEYRSLDALMPREESRKLISLLDFSSPAAMDQAVYLLMHELVDAVGRDWGPHDFPAPVLDRFNAFAIRELAIP